MTWIIAVLVALAVGFVVGRAWERAGALVDAARATTETADEHYWAEVEDDWLGDIYDYDPRKDKP
jgi:hypothetical protein